MTTTTSNIHPVFEHTKLTDQTIFLCKKYKKTSLIGTVGDYDFYEHPELGDVTMLVAHNKVTDEWGLSHWWDLPHKDDLE